MIGAPVVTLYVKGGCHLCQDAEAMLGQLRPRYPHRLETVDIETHPELYARYWDQIPVLVTARREEPAPLTPSVVERALAEVTP